MRLLCRFLLCYFVNLRPLHNGQCEDNMQMVRHKNLLFAHSRSASVHCSEAPAIPNLLLGIT